MKWRTENPEKFMASWRKCRAARPENYRRIKSESAARRPHIGRKSRRKRAGWAPGEHEKAEAALKTVTACACCGSPHPRIKSGRWVADHDHATGLFRGHLCHWCNIVVGIVEKHGLSCSPDVDAYLQRHRRDVVVLVPPSASAA